MVKAITMRISHPSEALMLFHRYRNINRIADLSTASPLIMCMATVGDINRAKAWLEQHRALTVFDLVRNRLWTWERDGARYQLRADELHG